MREQLLKDVVDGNDLSPGVAFVNSALGGEPARVRSLGEYDQNSYPEELAEFLRRRSQVASELVRIDVTDRDARIAAIPRLSRLLRTYPHPLAYELLIHAYVDAGKYDEAKGVAFAARERRLECERSPHPEIRAEIERLREWSPDEVDAMRQELQAKAR